MAGKIFVMYLDLHYKIIFNDLINKIVKEKGYLKKITFFCRARYISYKAHVPMRQVGREQ